MRLAPLAILLLLVAGCSGPREDAGEDWGSLEGAAPFSILLCKGGAARAGSEEAAAKPLDTCNHRVTLPLADAGRFDWTTQHGPGNEVSIAVNPLDPNNLIAGAKDYTVSYISDVAGCGAYTVWMGTFHSMDGGRTWSNDLMPGFPGDARPSPLKGNACGTDPVVVFDDDGTAWFHALNYVAGRDDSPVGIDGMGGHDLYTGSQLYFARSDDGGATYPGSGITFASFGDRDHIFNDKNWFAVQPGGDHMIATWSNFVSTPAPVPGVPSTGGPVIMFTESFDAGASWSTPAPFPSGTAKAARNVQFSMPQYLPGGRIAVIWGDYSNPTVASGAQVAYTEGIITPGGSVFAPAQAAFPMNPLKSGSARNGTGPSDFRISTYPVLAVDTSPKCPGRRYVVWADQAGPLDSDTQVLLRWSDDGRAWSESMAVNDVENGDQFMPWIDVDPDGGVHAAWYDRRNDPENRLLDVYYAYSADCGASFGANIRVTEINFDGDLGHHQTGVPFIGDYIGLDTTATSAHMVWADTRHTGQVGRLAGSDVYVATLLRDAEAAAPFLG
jgi:hypothetical protein